MKKTIRNIIAIVLIIAYAVYYLQTSRVDDSEYVEYAFRNENQLEEHYEKHGIEMGYDSKEDYLEAANNVINNEEALHKTEEEDNDDIYYLEETNEIVFVSSDGYIRTYFYPDNGIAYFEKQ